MMRLSVIVPTFDNGGILETCLSAISESARKPYEVIVVDDASTDRTKDVVKKFGYNYTRLKRNSGPATARNVGARTAKGDVLLFIDSDVRVRADTIAKVVAAYKNPDVMTYQGMASKTPLNKGFGPELLALRWYYMLHKTRNASYVHSHVFSIRKKVFFEIGGFDERFNPPGGGEEFELGHRLRGKYMIHTDPQLLVEHEFQGIISRTRTLYKRSYVWASLFSKTKRFEETNATQKEALIGVINLFAVFSLALSIFAPVTFYLFSFLLVAQTILNSGFYIFLLEEKGPLFFLKALPATMLWSIVQILGAIDFYIQSVLGKVE